MSITGSQLGLGREVNNQYENMKGKPTASSWADTMKDLYNNRYGINDIGLNAPRDANRDYFAARAFEATKNGGLVVNERTDERGLRPFGYTVDFLHPRVDPRLGFSGRAPTPTPLQQILGLPADDPAPAPTPLQQVVGLPGDVRAPARRPSPSRHMLGLDAVTSPTADDIDTPIAPERSDPNPYEVRDLWERRMAAG